MSEAIRVLHVDDNPDICSVTALHLEKVSSQFSVTTATSPETVLTTLSREPVDCLISDFDMPEMTGLELLESVREEYPDLPFILLTGKGSEEIASRAISAGVTGYLQKDTGTEQYEMLANRISNAVDRNRSKGALVDSQRRLGLLVDQSPLAVIEWSKQHEVVRWNEAAAEMFGHTAEEAMGNHVSFMLPESATGDVDTELLDSDGSQRGQQTTVTSDGERLVCEWHNLTVRDDDEVLSMFSLVEDVTERHDRKTELQRYETMVETVVDGVYTLDDDLHFTTVNDGMVSLTGYERERLVGSHLSLLLDSEEVARVSRAREQTYRSDSDTNTVKLTMETADGTTLPCEVRYRVQNTDGVFAGTTGVFRPLTE